MMFTRRTILAAPVAARFASTTRPSQIRVLYAETLRLTAIADAAEDGPLADLAFDQLCAVQDALLAERPATMPELAMQMTLTLANPDDTKWGPAMLARAHQIIEEAA